VQGVCTPANCSPGQDCEHWERRRYGAVRKDRIVWLFQNLRPLIALLLLAPSKFLKTCEVRSAISHQPVRISNASKAALLSYGDTLRVEMEPFG